MKQMIYSIHIIITILTLTVFLTNNVYSATIEAYVHIHVDKGQGTKRWNANLNCCDADNTYNCKIVKLEVPRSRVVVVEDPNGNGWNIFGNIETVDLQRLLDDNWIEVPRNGKNYPFSNAETLVIDQCNEIPELEGRIIQLNGIMTDNNGDFEVFVPNNNQ